MVQSMEIEVHAHKTRENSMTAMSIESMRMATIETYRQGYADGYAAALKQLQQLASEAGHSTSTENSSLQRDIWELLITTRTRNALLRAKIGTVGEVYNFHNQHGLNTIPRFGPKCFDELNYRLVEAGYPKLLGCTW